MEQIKKTLSTLKPMIRERFLVDKIGIFGSYGRGEQKPTSDIDVLVDFQRPVGIFAFLELANYLKNQLGIKVDLVTRKALRPEIGKQILREVVYL